MRIEELILDGKLPSKLIRADGAGFKSYPVRTTISGLCHNNGNVQA